MNLDFSSKQALYNWYVDQLGIHQKEAAGHSKYLFGSIKFFRGYLILCAVIIALQFLLFRLAVNDSAPSYYDFSSEYERALRQATEAENSIIAFSLAILMMNTSMAWFIYLLAWEKINLFKLMAGKKQIFRFGDDKLLSIRKSVRQLADNMSINYSRIGFWGIINSDNYPSVEENEETGEINLLIPMNFITLFNLNEDKGTAILAHELGHVLQKDTNLYLHTDAYFSIIRTILLPLTLVNIITEIGFSIYKMFSTDDSLPVVFWIAFVIAVGLGLVILRYLMVGFDKLRESRRISEKLADTAATIFANGEDLISVLNLSQDAGYSSTATHPDKIERIDYIKELLTSSNYVDV